MKKHCGQALSWEMTEGVVELALHREPLNEIGSTTLCELEEFIEELEIATSRASALIIYSALPQGFSAGADLRELYEKGRTAAGRGARRRGAAVSGAHPSRAEHH